jgi:hypothetical protein
LLDFLYTTFVYNIILSCNVISLNLDSESINTDELEILPCNIKLADPSGRAVYKAWVFGRSLAGIVGSNPARDMDICLL